MPRDIPLGNGSLQVAFDEHYQIRDVFFPHVGGENHAQGYPFRFGVWVDGEMPWLGPDWEISLDYEDDTLVSRVRAVHRRLGIELECQGAVNFHENLYLRRVRVGNLADRPRRALLFFHHDFYVGQSDLGNTALFDPKLQAIIHYRGSRYFLVNVLSDGRPGVLHYAAGVKRANGREGTWRDAEDGQLGGNPMAQGAVDSAISVPLDLEALGRREFHYWLAAGTTHREVRVLNQMAVERHPQSLIDRTAAYWRLWVRAGPARHGLGRRWIGAQGRAPRDRFLSIESIQGGPMALTRLDTNPERPPVEDDKLLHLLTRGIAGCRARDARQVGEALVQLIGTLNFDYEEATRRLFAVYEDCIRCVRSRQFERPLRTLESLRAAWAPAMVRQHRS